MWFLLVYVRIVISFLKILVVSSFKNRPIRLQNVMKNKMVKWSMP